MSRIAKPPEPAPSTHAATGSSARTLAELRRLDQAEDFFTFFELEFDHRVVQVYRLHVLKRFALEIDLIDREHPRLAEQDLLALYREALRRAHDLFARSTAQDQKLFRVFQDGGVVTLGRRS